MAINEENLNEEKKSISFVEQLVEEDLKEGKNNGRIQTRFPQSLMVICISAMPKLSAWTLVLQRNIMVFAIFVLMTLTLARKTMNM